MSDVMNAYPMTAWCRRCEAAVDVVPTTGRVCMRDGAPAYMGRCITCGLLVTVRIFFGDTSGLSNVATNPS